MSDHLTVSPYPCLPIDRSYRDFLEEHIARLETEREAKARGIKPRFRAIIE